MTEHHKQYPDLTGVTQLAVDIESHSPSLKTKGPGFIRGEDTVIGISLAWRELKKTPIFGLDPGVQSVYLPIKHTEGNLDRGQVCDFLNYILGRGIDTVYANAAFDLEGLRSLGINVTGQKRDIQIAEALIDENKKSYKLDVLAVSYLGEGKASEEMFIRGVSALGCKTSQVIENLHRLPAEAVAEYARTDAELTLRIMEMQAPKLTELGLDTVWNLECQLIDVLQAMRWKGVRLDRAGTVTLQGTLAAEERELTSAMTQIATREVNVWSQDSVRAAANKLGLTGLIDKGKQSFPAPWLAKQEHPFFKHLLKLRQLSKAGGAFLNSFLEHEHNGRIHCQFNQTRAVTGRLSSSNPNLQQLPARNEELAPKIRSLFLPDEGMRLAAFDHSQIEPRITVHYANLLGLSGAKKAVQAYTGNPDTDYHQWVSVMTGLPRFQAKQLNLALTYGAGRVKVGELLGLTLAEVEPLFKQYHEGVPFIRQLSKAVTRVAESRGYIKTLLGRRRNFNLYGPSKFEIGMMPKHYDDAVREWGSGVIRYFTYKALNSLIQATAADLLKKNMVDLYALGYVPHLSIHDEVLFSIEHGEAGDKAIKEIKEVMERSIAFDVPLKVDLKIGQDLGNMVEVTNE